MANYIKSKVQQSLSFLLVLVIAFSVFSGVLFLNPSPSYAYSQGDLERLKNGDKYLSGVHLYGADLSGADLSGADLVGANLDEANLSAADLSAADLSAAELEYANLSGANLSGADLYQAYLSSANLSGANLSGASLGMAFANRETKFPDGFDAVGAGVIFLD